MVGKKPIRIAVFASGSGTNAQQIFQHFGHSEVAEVALLVSNNPDALVLQRAQEFQIPSLVIDKRTRLNGSRLHSLLAEQSIDLIVLAGYMKLIPEDLVDAFRGRILNIHPALLPAYGGKGMYGDNVHLAVLENRDAYSGITIHFVDEEYDQGDIILQEKIKIKPGWDLSDLRAEIHKLEHQLYPQVIEQVCKDLSNEPA